jgi:hypothetical protein
MSTDNILFQDIFDIKDLDPQGKRFDRGIIWHCRAGMRLEPN